MYEKIFIHSPDLNNFDLAKIKSLGFTCIPTKPCPYFSKEVALHPDMQYFSLDNKLFCIGSAEICPSWLKAEEIELSFESKSYRNEAKLNLFKVGNYVLGNSKLCYDISLPKSFKFIHCNQGYAACSCLRVGRNGVITEDEGIASVLKKINIDVLLIKKGEVRLKGYPYGFIGGASCAINDNLVCFFGSLENHSFGEDVKSFLKKHQVCHIELGDCELTDLGGAVVLINSGK